MTALARLDVLTDRTCFPNPDHVVACLGFRVIGPDGNEVSALARNPGGYSAPRRGKRVPNGSNDDRPS